MRERPVVGSVEWVGAVDWDRRLFDELIPLPDGTSYNHDGGNGLTGRPGRWGWMSCCGGAQQGVRRGR